MTLELVCISGAVIYLFGQGKGAHARGWIDEGGILWGGHREGGTEIFEGGTCPPVPPPSDAPLVAILFDNH